MRLLYAIAAALAIAFAATNGTAQASSSSSPCNHVYAATPGKPVLLAYVQCERAHAVPTFFRPRILN